MMLMDALPSVLALAFFDKVIGVIQNGWEAFNAHPFLWGVLIVGLAVGAGLLIGASLTASFFVGAGIGMLAGIAAVLIAGNVGRGGSGHSGSSSGLPASAPDTQIRTVHKLLFTRPKGSGSLSVERESTPPTNEREEWGHHNMGQKIKELCQDLPPTCRTMKIEFGLNVPPRLRRLVIHHFYKYGIDVNEAVKTSPRTLSSHPNSL